MVSYDETIPLIFLLKPHHMSDEQMLEGLKQDKNWAFKEVYKTNFDHIYNLVTNNSGNLEDAKDLMQEVLIAFTKNVRKSNFILTCKLSTYIYSIAKNIWGTELRKRGKRVTIIDNENQEFIEIDDSQLEEKKEKEEKYEIIARLVGKMSERFQLIIIGLLYEEKTLTEIAETYGIDFNVAKSTKARGMKKLREALLGNPEYLKFLN